MKRETIDIDEDEYITPDEVAAQLRVCKRTVDRYVDSGKLPPKIIFNSKTHRFLRREVREYLRRMRRQDEEL